MPRYQQSFRLAAFLVWVERYLLFAIFLFLPSQLARHFWPDWAVIHQIRIDYISPAVYFTDLLILLYLLSRIVRHVADKNFLNKTIIRQVWDRKLQIVLLVVFLVSTLAVSISPWVTVIKLVQLVIYCLFGLTLVRRPFLDMYPISLGLWSSVIWTSLLGLAQFVFGHSLGGYLYWVGERPLSLAAFDVARVQLGHSGLYLRAYSSFPHPNAFAGFLVVSFLLLWQLRRNLSPALVYSSYLIGTLALLTTFSRSAWVALSFVLLVKVFRSGNKLVKTLSIIILGCLISLLVLVKHNSSWETRKDQYRESVGIILKHPMGIGLGTYPLILGNYPFQPVHSVPLLLIAELGLLWVFLMSFLAIRNCHYSLFGNSSQLIVVGLISLVDHYWLTLHSPLLLLVTSVSINYISTSVSARRGKQTSLSPEFLTGNNRNQ